MRTDPGYWPGCSGIVADTDACVPADRLHADRLVR